MGKRNETVDSIDKNKAKKNKFSYATVVHHFCPYDYFSFWLEKGVRKFMLLSTLRFGSQSTHFHGICQLISIHYLFYFFCSFVFHHLNVKD
jgi:hypothetical protein